MSASQLRLVGVDVTNTLIRVKGSPSMQYAQVAQSFGIRVNENQLADIWLLKYKQFCADYPNFGSAVKMPASVWWSSLVKDCFRAVDSSLDESVLDKVADRLYLHLTTSSAWEFLPGALEAVKDLRRYPVKTAVISNWDDRLEKVMGALKLRNCFDFILPSYVVGVQKPDPAIFLQAIKEAGCSPAEAVHFGDDLEKDFIGARNVGMDAYLLARDGRTYPSLDKSFLVPDVQKFVDAIRCRIGEPQDSD